MFLVAGVENFPLYEKTDYYLELFMNWYRTSDFKHILIILIMKFDN